MKDRLALVAITLVGYTLLALAVTHDNPWSLLAYMSIGLVFGVVVYGKQMHSGAYLAVAMFWVIGTTAGSLFFSIYPFNQDSVLRNLRCIVA